MSHYLPAALILSLFGTNPATAQSLDEIARVDVLPGWETPDGTHMAGLRVTLAPGWKTYWRAPGDAGIPPHFTWSGSSNIAGAQFHWPVPQVFHQLGMRSIGYHDSVVIPIELTPTAPGEPIRMAGELNIGVCEEICVPVGLSFAADLPLAGTRDGAITASLINQPMTAAEAGVGDVTCAVSPSDTGLQVTATMQVPLTGTNEEVVIEAGDPYIWVSEPAVTRSGAQLSATATMVHSSGQAFALDRSAVRITVISATGAVDIQGCTAG